MDVLEAMRQNYNGTLAPNELSMIYKEAVVEARIDALEREEMLQNMS